MSSQSPAPINTSRLPRAVATAWHSACGTPLSRRVSVASAARVPRRAPSHAGTRASRTVAAASAAGARSPRSSRAGRNRHRKNFLVITLAASGTASFSGGFRLFDALPVAPALPVPLLFARRRGPVLCLGLPPRPRPRRLPAPLAAIALPRLSRPKALLASLEQTQPGPRPARQPFPRAPPSCFSGWLVGFSGGPMGGHCSQKLLPRRGIALLSGAPISGSVETQHSIKAGSPGSTGGRRQHWRAASPPPGMLFFPPWAWRLWRQLIPLCKPSWSSPSALHLLLDPYFPEK